ncbi:pyruvate carboxyltransferase, partial [Micromonospora fluostatini]
SFTARLISKRLTTARFTTFCRAVKEDVAVAVDAAGTDRHEVQILATASDLHLTHKRRISRAEAVHEITETVRFARSLGVESVSIGLEDATRGAPELLRALITSSLDSGANAVVVADTSGCSTPQEFGDLISTVRGWAPPPVRLAVHCHDDLGLSLANSIAGLQAGADEVQTTLGGIGERAGNTALEQVVALLRYKGDQLGLYTDIDSAAMYEVYTLLRGVIGLDEVRNQPIFGQYAFGTAAGIHQHGVLRNPATYEFVEPAHVGRERSLIVARHSGRSVLHHLLGQLGAELTPEQTDTLYRRHILERPGGDCEDISVLRARLAEDLGLPR